MLHVNATLIVQLTPWSTARSERGMIQRDDDAPVNISPLHLCLRRVQDYVKPSQSACLPLSCGKIQLLST